MTRTMAITKTTQKITINHRVMSTMTTTKTTIKGIQSHHRTNSKNISTQTAFKAMDRITTRLIRVSSSNSRISGFHLIMEEQWLLIKSSTLGTGKIMEGNKKKNPSSTLMSTILTTDLTSLEKNYFTNNKTYH